MPAGTVSVRIVAGSPSNPVEGTDVTLVVNGTPRVARTDSAGRAIFKDLPVGATVQAKVADDDKKETASESFPLPERQRRAAHADDEAVEPGRRHAGRGRRGRRDARSASDERPAAPEQNDAAGMFTVRLTYDDFKDAPPVGVPVALVGYASDDTIRVPVGSAPTRTAARSSRSSIAAAPPRTSRSRSCSRGTRRRPARVDADDPRQPRRHAR